MAAGPRRRGAGWPGPAARAAGSRSAGRADRSAAQGEGPAGAGAGQGPLCGGRAGKTAGALGDALRERGHRAEVSCMADEAVATLAPRTGTRAACAAVGCPQASYCRRHRASPPVRRAPGPHAKRAQPRALIPAERQAILDVLHSGRLADLAPAEMWATLLD